MNNEHMAGKLHIDAHQIQKLGDMFGKKVKIINPLTGLQSIQGKFPKYTLLSLGALALLPIVYAGSCEVNRDICLKSCGGPADPRENAAGMVGCHLAYIACKAVEYFKNK